MVICLRILVYFVIYDCGQVSLEHLLLSRHPSHDMMNENLLSQPTLSLLFKESIRNVDEQDFAVPSNSYLAPGK